MAKPRSDLLQAASRYDRDFVSWTREQARLLRRAAARRSMNDLDFENLAEENESLGKRGRRALASKVAGSSSPLGDLGRRAPFEGPQDPGRQSRSQVRAAGCAGRELR